MPADVSHVPPEQVGIVWPQILDQVERGLRHAAGDTITADHILRSILQGDMILWVVHEGDNVTAAIILEVIQHPAKKTLAVVLIAGRDFHGWCEQVNQMIRDFADLIGVDSVESVSRRGAAKWLESLGWRRKAIVMEQPNGR